MIKSRWLVSSFNMETFHVLILKFLHYFKSIWKGSKCMPIKVFVWILKIAILLNVKNVEGSFLELPEQIWKPKII